MKAKANFCFQRTTACIVLLFAAVNVQAEPIPAEAILMAVSNEEAPASNLNEIDRPALGTPPFLGAGTEVWKQDFRSPPAAFKSMPLWWFEHRDYSTPEAKAEMRKQLLEFRDKAGFTGITPLFLTRDYLTEAYWEQVSFILETCKELGLKVVFYDDVGFPSGSAGGFMRRMFPDDTHYRLDLLEETVTGPAAFNKSFSEMPRIMSPSEAGQYEDPKRWESELSRAKFAGAVAMNMETGERRDISAVVKDQHLIWDVPAGSWKVMAFLLTQPSGGYVDYLNPASVDKFLSITYDELYKRFPSYFGDTIIMTFFDDVGVRGSGGHGAFRRIWTPIFNEQFEKKHGFNPVTLLPALWHDIGGDTEAARNLLLGFRAELLAEGFPRRTHDWAQRHGLISSGHAMGQYKEQPAFMAGDNILFYKHSDAPMIDSIGGYHATRKGYKFTSSAATSFDRSLTAVEIYGIYTDTSAMTPDLFYRGAMDCMVRGANIFLPHGVWFNPDNVKIQPELSHRNPNLAPILPEYNDWIGRCSLLLRGGRPVADIAVFYPIATLLSHARLNAPVDEKSLPDNTHPGDWVPPGTNLLAISDKLTGEIRRDFTFLHPEVLRDRCVVKPGVLRLDNPNTWQEYKVVILPYAKLIEVGTLTKLKEFVEAGGKLISVGPTPYRQDGQVMTPAPLPSRSADIGRDAEVVEAVRALFGCEPDQVPSASPFVKQANAAGGAVYFVSNVNGPGLQAALDDALPVADVSFADPGPKIEPRKGMLSYLHKVRDGRSIYFFANTSEEMVDMDITIRGKRSLEAWNPHNGGKSTVETREVEVAGETCTSLRLRLDPTQTIFFVEKIVENTR